MCELLRSRGHRVRALVRRTSDLTWIEDLGLELVYGDLRDRGSLDAAAQGMEWVFHTAATVRPRDPADYEQVNYEGARMMAEACAAAGVNRFVLFSSVAAGGPAVNPDRPRTERDEPRPVSRYGRGKLKAEQALLELADRLRSVILRFPAVYGPRDKDSLVLLRNLKRGVATVLKGTFSVIHVFDAVRAALLAAERDVASGSVYFVSDGCVHTYDEMVGIVGKLLDRRSVKVRVPRWALKPAGRVSEWFSREGSIFNRDKAEELSQDCWVCSPGKAQAELGFEPEYELARGMSETIRLYQEREWL